MATRHIISALFVILSGLFLSNSAFSEERSKGSESSGEEVNRKIGASGELTITFDSGRKKEEGKSKIQISSKLNLTSESDKKDPENKWKIGVWAGYSFYEMNRFNDKLSSENNETIDGGLNIGLEVTPKKFTLDLSEVIKLMGLSFIKPKDLELPTNFPIGFEYLEAKSRTIHGGNTTVNWELPVTGIYFSPEMHLLGKSGKSEGLSLKLRPFGVGYYTLGKLMDAELTVTSIPGYLKVSGEAIGMTSLAAIKYKQKEDFEIFVEGGYRWLEFTDVLREPKNGFAGGAPASQLPEDLD